MRLRHSAMTSRQYLRRRVNDMNKKIFSGKLMFEGMRQVKLPGIIGLILIAGASFFTSFIEVVNMSRGMYVLESSFSELNLYIQLVMFTAAPLMTLMLFGFMNRRCASDFYHSLAYTRLCIYTSFVAAVLLWCIMMIMAGSAITLAVCGISGKIKIDVLSIPYPILSAVAGVLIVTGGTVLAMTLTGTYLTNVFTAVLFLFAPRALIFYCNRLLVSSMPYVVFSQNTFISKLINIPFDLVTGIFGISRNSEAIITSWVPAVYTALIGIILMCVGAVCFTRRKSEHATMASVNRVLQGILRVITTVLISLIAVALLFDAHKYDTISDSDKFVIIMTYVGAAVAYFLYEAVTTRHLRNFVRIIPGLAIVAVINVVLYFSLITSYDYNMKLAPDKDEIAYVMVYGPTDSVLWKDSENMKLYSDAAREVASDCLKDTIRMWDEDKSDFYSENRMVIEYRLLDGSSISRMVAVTDARYAQLKNVLFNDKDFAGNFGKSIYSLENIEYGIGNLGTEREKVYNVFRDELKESGAGKLFDLISDGRTLDSAFTTIDLWKKNSDRIRFSSISIGADMPKTAAAYMNAVNEEYPENELDKALDMIETVKSTADKGNGADNTYLYGGLNLTVYTIKKDGTMSSFNAYPSMYYSEGYGFVPSDECVENIKKLNAMINARKIGSYDITPGMTLLYVEYYENRQIDTTGEEKNGAETSTTSTAVMMDLTDYGWYVIDENMYDLIKLISIDNSVEVEVWK